MGEASLFLPPAADGSGTMLPDDACSGWSQAAISADEADIKHWLKARAAMFDIGRGKPLSAPGSRRVWHDAAGRCMFR
ncbi:hypothetical protein CP993_25790, partial [Escherichia coli]